MLERPKYQNPVEVTKVVILSAGYGTRLGSITKKKPKVLVKINGFPVIEYIYTFLTNQGFNNICVNLHHLPLQIMDYLKNKPFVFLSPESKLMGTAGALKNIDYWLSDPFIVINGDTITNLDLNKMLTIHKMGRAIATVYTKDSLTHNGGVFIFSKSVLNNIPSNKFYSIVKDLIPKLVKEGQSIATYEDFKSWYFDIGTPKGLRRARSFFTRNYKPITTS